MTSKSTGAFGEPPPDAPREVSQPLTADALADMAARAAQNEQQLQPLTYKDSQVNSAQAQVAQEPQAVPPEQSGIRQPRRPAVSSTPAETMPAGADQGTLAERLHAAVTPRPERSAEEPYRPAASDSDSPARGIPQPVLDPGKKITGGFGVPGVGPVQYYPLDGYELRQLVERMCDQLKQRLQDDLRFMRAVTYPRLTCRLDLTVECWGAALQKHEIPVVIPPKGPQTALDVAREYGADIVFVVSDRRAEFDASGTPETATNAMREEIDAPIPFKRPVATRQGTATDWVDVEQPTGLNP